MPITELGAEIGMLVVETIAKFRRAGFVHEKPFKQIEPQRGGFHREVHAQGKPDPVAGVRPCRWTGSGGGFDGGAGAAVLELDGAEIAQGEV